MNGVTLKPSSYPTNSKFSQSQYRNDKQDDGLPLPLLPFRTMDQNDHNNQSTMSTLLPLQFLPCTLENVQIQKTRTSKPSPLIPNQTNFFFLQKDEPCINNVERKCHPGTPSSAIFYYYEKQLRISPVPTPMGITYLTIYGVNGTCPPTKTMTSRAALATIKLIALDAYTISTSGP